MRAVAAAVLVLLAAPAGAQPAGEERVIPPIGDDYRIESARWNGLSTLAGLARALGWRVEEVRSIEWSEIGPDDLLLLLYPTQPLEARDLETFLRGGGRVILGDDFGRGGEALARLGVVRDDAGPVAGERFYRELRFAPIARPAAPEHPLARGVEELVGNHPSALKEVRGPEVVFSFGPGEHTVAAGRLGAGSFVLLSDPSMLINRMLEFPGNLAFAVNLLRYLERDGEAPRLLVLAGDFSFYGRPSAGIAERGLRGSLSRFFEDLDRWFEHDVNAYVVTEPGARLTALLAGLAIALAALFFLPGRRAAPGSGSFARVEPLAPATDFESVVAVYDRGRPPRSFLLPASVIRDTVNARLARVLEVREPLYSLTRAELLSELERRRGAEAARALASMLPALRALPTRAQATSPWESALFSRTEFARLAGAARELYRSLGEG